MVHINHEDQSPAPPPLPPMSKLFRIRMLRYIDAPPPFKSRQVGFFANIPHFFKILGPI